MNNKNNTTNSLAHTKWNCKYHIVFAPKYRRRSMSRPYTLTGEYTAEIQHIKCDMQSNMRFA